MGHTCQWRRAEPHWLPRFDLSGFGPATVTPVGVRAAIAGLVEAVVFQTLPRWAMNSSGPSDQSYTQHSALVLVRALVLAAERWPGVRVPGATSQWFSATVAQVGAEV